MSLKDSDIREHNNPNNAHVDSDFVRGGGRVVNTLSEMYALASINVSLGVSKKDQLKEHITIIKVLDVGAGISKRFELVNINDTSVSGSTTVFNPTAFVEFITDAIAANTAKIEAETTRAELQESLNATAISSEFNNRTNADNALQYNINSEVTARTEALRLKADNSIFKEEVFTYSSSSSFTVVNDVINVYGVFVNGQRINKNEFTRSLKVFTITHTLNSGNTVEILYNYAAVGSEYDLSVYSKKTEGILVWSAIPFSINSTTSYLGKYWKSNAETISTDVPGTSSKWVDNLIGYATNAIFKEKTDNILNTNDEFVVADKTGNVVFKADVEGAKSTKYLVLNSLGKVVATFDKDLYDRIIAKLAEGDFSNLIDNPNYANSFSIIDQFFRIGLKYDADGLDAAKLSDHFKTLLPSLGGGGSIQIESSFTGDYVMNIVYGQSLALGGSTITDENVYTSKTFTNGLSVPHSYSDVTQANNEATQQARFLGISDMSSSGGTNNARMICKKINELIIAENNKTLEDFNHNQFGLVSGASGGQWYQLAKWSENRANVYVSVVANAMPTALIFGANSEGRNYLNLVQAIYFANKFAKSAGKKLTVGSLSYIQGEASSDKDNTVAQFKAKLDALFNDISVDVTTITGQSVPVKFILYQNASFALYNEPSRPEYSAGIYTEGVPLACVEITKDRTDTYFGTPLYPFSPTIHPTNDMVHLSNIGYAMMSSLLGVQAKRVINDDNPLPLFEPITGGIKTWQSSSNWFTYIPFSVPIKPMVFDVDGVSGVNMRGHGLQANYGFSILNGSTQIITNVRISSDDSIVITTNQNPVGKSLTYALTGAMGGGNLRDSQGEKIKTSFNTLTYRLDNWCPFFRITI